MFKYFSFVSLTSQFESYIINQLDVQIQFQFFLLGFSAAMAKSFCAFLGLFLKAWTCGG